jgi:hypothetical protein
MDRNSYAYIGRFFLIGPLRGAYFRDKHSKHFVTQPPRVAVEQNLLTSFIAGQKQQMNGGERRTTMSKASSMPS